MHLENFGKPQNALFEQTKRTLFMKTRMIFFMMILDLIALLRSCARHKYLLENITHVFKTCKKHTFPLPYLFFSYYDQEFKVTGRCLVNFNCSVYLVYLPQKLKIGKQTFFNCMNLCMFRHSNRCVIFSKYHAKYDQ